MPQPRNLKPYRDLANVILSKIFCHLAISNFNDRLCRQKFYFDKNSRDEGHFRLTSDFVHLMTTSGLSIDIKIAVRRD